MANVLRSTQKKDEKVSDRDPASRILRITDSLAAQFELEYLEADELVTRIAAGEKVYDAVNEIRSRREGGNAR